MEGVYFCTMTAYDVEITMKGFQTTDMTLDPNIKATYTLNLSTARNTNFGSGCSYSAQ